MEEATFLPVSERAGQATERRLMPITVNIPKSCLMGCDGQGSPKECSRLRESFRQVEAEVVSNSRDKIHQTWSTDFT